MRTAWFASAALFLAFPALAQETVVEELVVTGTPYAVSIDSAATHVEVLGRTELETAQPGGLGDALASLPGLRSSAFGPGASRPIIRGQSGPRVLVLQNGVGLVDASSLSPDHAVAADPMASQRIEILRGPSTLAYGGSAIGGVVNVIDDRIPRVLPQEDFTGRLAVSAGGPGDGWAANGGLIAAAGRVAFTADVNHHESGDYATPSAPVSARLAGRDGLLVDPRRIQLNTAVEFDAYGAGAAVIGEHGHLGLGVKRTESLYGVPFAQVLGPADPDAEGPVAIDLAQTRYDLRGEHAFDFGPFERLRFAVGRADYEHREQDAATFETHTRFLSTGTEGRVEFIQAERDGWQGAFGLQGLGRELEAIGDEAFIPPSRIEEQGLFVLQRRDFGGFGLEGGVRVDRRKVAAELSGRAPSDAADAAGIDWAAVDAGPSFENVSASAAIFWRPAQGAFLALVAAHNARAPTEFELFADGPHPGAGAFEVGDPTIGSEAVTSLEATARWRAGRLRLEGHVFGAAYDGFIDQRPTGEVEDGLPVFRFVQTDARFVGAEVEAGLDLWSSGGRSIGLDLSADYLNASSDLGPPARMPPPAVTARLTYLSERLETFVEVRSVAHQDRIAPFELPTDSHTLVNAGLTWRPRGADRLRLYVEGRNLTDETVREHVSFVKDILVQPGRSLRAGVAARF